MSRRSYFFGLRLPDLFELAYDSLRANFLRSSLTILGVSIGVFSVVAVMTTLSAVRQSIDTGLSSFGTNVMQISRDPALRLDGGPRWQRGRPPISPRQAQEFKQYMDEEGIPTTLSSTDRGERARYRDLRTQPRISIVGTNENYLLTHKYELEYGRNISPADVEFNRSVTVIGSELLEELFPHEDPIGKVIKMDGDRYEVIGVLKKRGDNFGQSMDGVGLIPITKFVQNNWHRWRSMDLAVQAPSPEAMANVEDVATGYMRLVRELDPENPNNFEITSNESLQATFAEIAVIVGTAGLLISAIALVCAGIGIMNIMLVSVTERTREIGVRKSLGARKVGILYQFLLEAVFLSELGAFAGIMGGFVVGNIVAVQLKASMIVPWFWIGAAILVCSLIGIGFGLLPALRASNLKPVDALRYE